jgi:dihydroorotase
VEKINLSKDALIDILFYGGVLGNLDKLKAMSTLVCGYKIYAEETTGSMTIGLDEIEKALRIISDTDKPVVFHAGENLKEILDICENYDVRVHIAHVSSISEINIIEKYKKKMQLTCEATPHHLFFSEKDKEKLGYLSTVNPPRMPEKDRAAVMDALKTGTIDMLATDHAPHTLEDKAKGASGFPQLDTYGPFVSWLIEKCFSLQRISKITSFNAANLLKINNIARICNTHLANLTVLDMQAEKVDKLYTKCGWSPFDGMKLKGWPVKTFVRGKLVYDEGKIDKIKGKEVSYV